MIYTFQLKVNGTDVANYGFSVAELRGHWDAPGLVFDEVSIPGDFGTTPTVATPLLDPLDFTVVGELIGTSPSDFESKLDVFKQALSLSTLTLIGGNNSARQRTGVYAGPMTVVPYALMDSGLLTFKIRCRNPLAYDTTLTTVTGAAASAVTCVQGTYPSRPIISLATCSNPTLTYANASGTTIQTLTITATGTMVIDCSAHTVTINGARNDAAISLGDFFTLDPRDGTYGSTSPTIKSSSGSLTGVYRKAYL
jgi:phage-related protein